MYKIVHTLLCRLKQMWILTSFIFGLSFKEPSARKSGSIPFDDTRWLRESKSHLLKSLDIIYPNLKRLLQELLGLICTLLFVRLIEYHASQKWGDRCLFPTSMYLHSNYTQILACKKRRKHKKIALKSCS